MSPSSGWAWGLLCYSVDIGPQGVHYALCSCIMIMWCLMQHLVQSTDSKPSMGACIIFRQVHLAWGCIIWTPNGIWILNPFAGPVRTEIDLTAEGLASRAWKIDCDEWVTRLFCVLRQTAPVMVPWVECSLPWVLAPVLLRAVLFAAWGARGLRLIFSCSLINLLWCFIAEILICLGDETAQHNFF